MSSKPLLAANTNHILPGDEGTVFMVSSGGVFVKEDDYFTNVTAPRSRDFSIQIHKKLGKTPGKRKSAHAAGRFIW
jgi:hypothetical protein